jgi:hypothetical protein
LKSFKSLATKSPPRYVRAGVSRPSHEPLKSFRSLATKSPPQYVRAGVSRPRHGVLVVEA